MCCWIQIQVVRTYDDFINSLRPQMADTGAPLLHKTAQLMAI